MADDEDVAFPVGIAFLGIALAYVSILATAFLASDGRLIAALGADVPVVRNVAVHGLFFLLAVAPFLAVAMWASVHDVAVSLFGEVPIQSVPLFGVLDGALQPAIVLLLVLGGLLAASEVAETPIGRAVGGTVVGIGSYVVAGWLFALGSALVFDFFISFSLAVLFGSMAPIENSVPIIYYADPVGVAVQLAVFAGPLIAFGAVLNGAGTLLFADRAEAAPAGRPNAASAEPDSRSGGRGENRRGPGTDRERSTANSSGEPVGQRQATAGGETPRRSAESAQSESRDVHDEQEREDADEPAERNDADGEGRGNAAGADVEDSRWREEWYDEDRRRSDR